MSQKRLTRREFLRVSALGAAGVLAASCAPQVVEKTVEVPVEVEKEVIVKETVMVEVEAEAPADLLAGKQVHVLGWTGDGFPDLNDKFVEETGIQVVWEIYPKKFENTMAKLTMWGESGYDGIGVIAMADEPTALYAFKDWSADLAHIVADEADDQIDAAQGLVDLYGIQNRVYYTAGGEPFYRNMDLVPEAPKDWDELVEFAQKVTDPAADIWGWRPNAGTHVANLTLMLFNHAGGDTTNFSDEPIRDVLQFMYDWVFKYEITPKTVINETSSEIRPLAADGRAGMWWDYDSGFNAVLDVDDGQLTKANLGASRWPMGPVSDHAMVHAWGFVIPTFSGQTEVAEEYAGFVWRKDNAKELCLARGMFPARKSLYEDPDIIDAIPLLASGPGWNEMMRDAVFRCPWACAVQTTALVRVYTDIIHRIWAEEMTVDEAWKWAQDEIADIWAS